MPNLRQRIFAVSIPHLQEKGERERHYILWMELYGEVGKMPCCCTKGRQVK